MPIICHKESVETMAKDGQESNSEKDLVKSFRAATVTQDKEVALLMGNGMEDNNGQTLSGGLTSKYGYLEGKESQAQKKKKDKRFNDLLLRIMLRHSIKWMQEVINYHVQQMELLAKKIAAIQKQLKELLEEEKALKEVLEYYQEEGAFKLDSLGRLKNGIAECALQKWKDQTGQQFDHTGTEIYLVLLKIHENNEAEQMANESGLEQAETDYNYHKKQKDEAQEILNDLESADPEKCQNALQRIESMSFEQEVEIAIEANKQGKANSIENAEKILTEEDLEWDDFSFNFPPLKDEFENASAGENNKKEKVKTQSPATTQKLPTLGSNN